jgi:hypothetical protein
LLEPRVTGPALQVRSSQIHVAAVRDDNEQITVIPNTYQQLIIPTTEGWPRTLWAITAVTDLLQPPRLLALEQVGARDPYKLWGWVQLQPGVIMPAFADPRVGTEDVPLDDATLVMTPTEAVRQYADLLVNGDASAYVGNFSPMADDEFRTLMWNWRTAQEQALQGDRIQGTYTLAAEPISEFGIRAVRSADGGAMIMAALKTSERLEAMQGAILSPQTPTALALLDGQEFTNILLARYTDMIVLYIPAAGSSEPVRLLGYSHIQTGADVADPPQPEEAAPTG